MTNAVSNSGAPRAITMADVEGSVSGGVTTGSAEMVVAEAAAQLQDAAERSRVAGRLVRSSQRTMQRAALDERRKAAALQLAAGLVNGAAQAAQGVASFASASQDLSAATDTAASEQFAADEQFLKAQDGGPSLASERAGDLSRGAELRAAEHGAASKRASGYGSVAQGAGTAASSLISYFGERASIEASALDQAAAAAGEAADDAEAAQESAEAAADRALQKLSELEQRRHQASMATVRG